MIINYNSMASNALRQLNINSTAQAKSMAKLSSGLRINSAADDAAGLTISESMKGQIRGLDQASRNAQDGQSMTQTAEGALNETTDILQRMRELAVQSSNDTNTTDDRGQIQKEFNQLTSEINRIGNNTEFNNQKLLNGDKDTSNLTANGGKGGAAITLQIGANQDQSMSINISDMRSAVLGLSGTTASTSTTPSSATGVLTDVTGAQFATATATDGTSNALTDVSTTGTPEYALDLSTSTSASAAIKVVDEAINRVSTERSKLGAYSNRLDHTINNLNTSSQNISDAQSRIADVDMAKEMMNQSKSSVLAQAAQAMLAQANQQPQQVLQLLR